VSAAVDMAKLKDVLAELVACRQLLDEAFGNG
jgi:hypothetical protein